MKRLFAFLLACVLLCACSACKKESPPAPEPAQTTKTDPEQTISGLSVRIPVTQYRLGRTEPELLDFFISRATLKSHSVASAMSCSIIKSLL